MTELEAIVVWLRDAAQKAAEAGNLTLAMYLQSLTYAIEAGQHLENNSIEEPVTC